MTKFTKTDVITLMAGLKAKGYSNEQLGVMLDKTSQTIWAWSSNATKRVPCKSDYEVLRHLLDK